MGLLLAKTGMVVVLNDKTLVTARGMFDVFVQIARGHAL